MRRRARRRGDLGQRQRLRAPSSGAGARRIVERQEHAGLDGADGELVAARSGRGRGQAEDGAELGRAHPGLPGQAPASVLGEVELDKGVPGRGDGARDGAGAGDRGGPGARGEDLDRELDRGGASAEAGAEVEAEVAAPGTAAAAAFRPSSAVVAAPRRLPPQPPSALCAFHSAFRSLDVRTSANIDSSFDVNW